MTSTEATQKLDHPERLRWSISPRQMTTIYQQITLTALVRIPPTARRDGQAETTGRRSAVPRRGEGESTAILVKAMDTVGGLEVWRSARQ